MDLELADTKMEVTTLNNCFQFVQVCNFFYGSRKVSFWDQFHSFYENASRHLSHVREC